MTQRDLFDRIFFVSAEGLQDPHSNQGCVMTQAQVRVNIESCDDHAYHVSLVPNITVNRMIRKSILDIERKIEHQIKGSKFLPMLGMYVFVYGHTHIACAGEDQTTHTFLLPFVEPALKNLHEIFQIPCPL